MSSLIPPSQPAAPLIGPVLVPETAVPLRAGAVSFMSKHTHEGEWLLPRLFRAFAWMGELHVDLTRVRLGAGASDLELVVFMGQINVRVPQNLRVECAGTPVMGEMKVNWGAGASVSADAPLVRIHAGGMMGTIIVNIVDPNAPAWLEGWRNRRRGG